MHGDVTCSDFFPFSVSKNID